MRILVLNLHKSLLHKSQTSHEIPVEICNVGLSPKKSKKKKRKYKKNPRRKRQRSFFLYFLNFLFFIITSLFNTILSRRRYFQYFPFDNSLRFATLRKGNRRPNSNSYPQGNNPFKPSISSRFLGLLPFTDILFSCLILLQRIWKVSWTEGISLSLFPYTLRLRLQPHE